MREVVIWSRTLPEDARADGGDVVGAGLRVEHVDAGEHRLAARHRLETQAGAADEDGEGVHVEALGRAHVERGEGAQPLADVLYVHPEADARGAATGPARGRR